MIKTALFSTMLQKCSVTLSYSLQGPNLWLMEVLFCQFQGFMKTQETDILHSAVPKQGFRSKHWTVFIHDCRPDLDSSAECSPSFHSVQNLPPWHPLVFLVLWWMLLALAWLCLLRLVSEKHNGQPWKKRNSSPLKFDSIHHPNTSFFLAFTKDTSEQFLSVLLFVFLLLFIIYNINIYRIYSNKTLEGQSCWKWPTD